MSTMADFSSLLQVGFGLGIGITLYRAPIDLRVTRLTTLIDSQLQALKGLSSDSGRLKRRRLFDCKLQLAEKRLQLERILVPFMVAALAGATLNLALLVDAAANAQGPVSTTGRWTLITVAVFYFLALLILLEIVARMSLARLTRNVFAGLSFKP